MRHPAISLSPCPAQMQAVQFKFAAGKNKEFAAKVIELQGEMPDAS